MLKLFGQAICFVAMAVGLSIYKGKKKKILATKFTTDVLWVLHHAMIGTYTAALTTFISIFREIVFYNKEKKWAKSKLWLYLFIALYILIFFIKKNNAQNILPSVASIILTIAFWCDKPNDVRKYGFISSVCMLIYGICCRSYATVVNEIFVESSIVIYLINEKRHT